MKALVLERGELKLKDILPQSISDIEVVFIEPLAASLEIFEQIRIGREDSVLVLGDGKLGFLAYR